MTGLDLRTLIVLTTVGGLLLTVGIEFIRKVVGDEEAVRWWSQGTAAMSVGNILLALRGVLPDLLTVLLANFLFVWSWSHVQLGLRRFVGLPTGPRWDWILGGTLLAIFIPLTYLTPSVAWRITVFSFLLGGSLLQTARLFLGHFESTLRPPARLLGGTMLLGSLVLFVRGAATPYTVSGTDLLDQTHWIQVTTFLVFLLLQLALAVALPLLVAGRMKRTLGVREASLRLLNENTRDALVQSDASGQFLHWNVSFSELLGHSSADLAVMSERDVTPAKWHAVDAQVEHGQLASSGRSAVYEKELLRSDGSTVAVEVRKFTLMDDDGHTPSVWTVVRDISARKQAEDELRSREAMLRTTQQIAHLGSWTIDLANGRTGWSEETFAIFGLRPGEFEPGRRAVAELTVPEDRTSLDEWIRACTAGDQPHEREFRIRRSDGEIRYLVGRGALETGPDGKPRRVVGSVQDVTDRRLAELDAGRANRLLKEAVESLEQGFTIYDEQDRLLLCNDAYLNMYAESRDLIVPGARFEDIVRTGAVRGQYKAAVGRIDEWVRERVSSHQTADGHYVEQQLGDGRWLLIVEHRAPSGVIVGNRIDITARKDLELELDQHRTHLADLVADRTRELSRAKEDAEAANAAKSAFLANMSHEIRTPMNAILGMVALIRSEPLTPLQSERLGKLHHAGAHLLEVLNAILDLSRIDSGRFEFEAVPLDLRRILDEVTELIRDAAIAKGLNLVTEADLKTVNLMGDPTRLRQALMNYASNAVKFTDAGAITLRAMSLEETSHDVVLRFEVEDSGIGIEERAVARLFSAFEQADNTMTRRYGGTGLGLAITKKLAEMMGGSVGVRSRAGAGSTFWFTARLAKAADLAASQPAKASPATETGQGLASRHVLLAEDEPINREIVVALLEAEGAAVDCAVDGLEAVEKAISGNYDLILMDLQMPRLDGFDAMKSIRMLPGRSRTPIIALTANAFVEDRQQCLAAGFDDFIAKPVEPEHLYATLSSVLARRSV